MRAAVLLKLYPAAWRRRYGQELEDLLELQKLTPSLALDLLRGAADAHLHPALARRSLVAAAGPPTVSSAVKRPSALIPLGMSSLALCLVVGHIAIFGVARQPDEGAEAHLWQLLMAGQLPVILFFAIVWLPRHPRQALLVLLLQLVAALAAAAPVFLLKW